MKDLLFDCASFYGLASVFQQIAYQYAKKGARLALVARREGSLHEVAAKAKDIGSPDVLVVAGDVSNPEDCQKFVQTTVERFGQCKMECLVIQSSKEISNW